MEGQGEEKSSERVTLLDSSYNVQGVCVDPEVRAWVAVEILAPRVQSGEVKSHLFQKSCSVDQVESVFQMYLQHGTRGVM